MGPSAQKILVKLSIFLALDPNIKGEDQREMCMCTSFLGADWTKILFDQLLFGVLFDETFLIGSQTLYRWSNILYGGF